jgi:hypothetical protein
VGSAGTAGSGGGFCIRDIGVSLAISTDPAPGRTAKTRSPSSALPDGLRDGVFVQGSLVFVGSGMQVEDDLLDSAGEWIGALSS